MSIIFIICLEYVPIKGFPSIPGKIARAMICVEYSPTDTYHGVVFVIIKVIGLKYIPAFVYDGDTLQ